MKTVTPDVLQERLNRGEGFQMIDVRSAGEYAAGHLPCAVNLPMEQVERRLDDLHHRDPVVLICQTGRRPVLTRELLQPHVNDLLVLEGGTAAWERAGLPLVRATATRWSLDWQVRLGLACSPRRAGVGASVASSLRPATSDHLRIAAVSSDRRGHAHDEGGGVPWSQRHPGRRGTKAAAESW